MDFLRNNLRFSFKYDGKDAFSHQFEKKVEESGNTITTTYLFPHGLKVTNIAKYYEKYGAYEWVNWFENVSDTQTDIITELFDCDAKLPFPHSEPFKYTAWTQPFSSTTSVDAPMGSLWSLYDFYCDVEQYQSNRYQNVLFAGDSRHYETSAGRSSEKQAPFFDISYQGHGVIAAIGWTGQWNCDILRESDSVIIRSKIEDTEFRMLPGEKFRTSSIVLMPYDCGVTNAHNKWRRLLRDDFSSVKKGDNLPFCAGVWGGMNTSDALKRVEFIKENKLPFEYIWMDAGWFGAGVKESPDEYEGDWFGGTGNWEVNKNRHPDGLLELASAIKEAGLKYLLWFEPERAFKIAPILREHPEMFLKNSQVVEHFLLNLGDEKAWQYCFDMVAGYIEKLGLSCYRQDFNHHDTLRYWRENDVEGRRGISEIKHINGLYRFLDALLEKFPQLLIDNCASGGRRIDIEMMKRSVPLWRSDAQCPANPIPEITQAHNISFSRWIPYSGTGTGRMYDEYCVRSAYSGGLTTNWTFSARDELKKPEWIKKYAEEYLIVRPYFYGDIYPLTEISNTLDVWSAVRFDRPEEHDGMIEVFKRERSCYNDAVFAMENINPEKDYLFIDLDGGTFTVSGKELSEKGFSVRIEEKRKAKIFIYSEV